MTDQDRNRILNALFVARISYLILIGNSCIRVGLFGASSEYGRVLDQLTIASLAAGLYVFAHIVRSLVSSR